MRPIKVKTIKLYIKVAADFAVPLGLPDPRLDARGRSTPFLCQVYDAIKRYESIPNRRNPVTTAMVRHMVSTRGTDHNSVPFALTDFQIIGRYAGLRLGEYAQYKPHEIIRSTDGSLPKAFIMDDFVFYGPAQQHFPQPASRHIPPSLAHSTTIPFREQKNGDNG